MRLWSISPSYLDTVGLVACWREALLAQSCLIKGEFSICPYCGGNREQTVYPFKSCKKCNGKGEIKTPYYNHPQLERFKISGWKYYFGTYLFYLREEAKKRGYNFDKDKIQIFQKEFQGLLTVTKGQLIYEFKHLQNKLHERNKERYWKNQELHYLKTNPFDLCGNIEHHPLFKVVDGEIESWEKQI